MPFYSLTANKTHDVFHNSEPLALLRPKNTRGGALISVDFGGLIYGTTFVLVF